MALSCFTLTGCGDASNSDTTAKISTTATINDEAILEAETFLADTFSLSTGNDWIYDEALSTSLKSETVNGFYFYRNNDTNDTNADTTPADHMIIVIEDLSSTGKDFDTFKNMTLTQLQSGISTELSPESDNINGYEAFKIKYDTTIDSNLCHNYLISMNIENVIYSFSYTCYADDCEEEFSLFYSLVSSAAFN